MSQPESNPRPQMLGAASLVAGGIAASFGVASCCALPMLLASVGVGSAGLASIALAASPHRTLLLTIGALCLLAGAGLLIRQQVVAARCGPGEPCVSRTARAATLVGLIVGAVLLWLGYTYV